MGSLVGYGQDSSKYAIVSVRSNTLKDADIILSYANNTEFVVASTVSFYPNYRSADAVNTRLIEVFTRLDMEGYKLVTSNSSSTAISGDNMSIANYVFYKQ
jgi:hypothetical protein